MINHVRWEILDEAVHVERIRELILESLPVGLTTGLDFGPYSRERLRMEIHSRLDPHMLALTLSTELLAMVKRDEIQEHHEDVIVVTAAFATWWDHFKATYRGRWWMRWRRWTIRYTESEQVHRVTVRVRADLAAIFPEASVENPRGGRTWPVVLGIRSA